MNNNNKNQIIALLLAIAIGCTFLAIVANNNSSHKEQVISNISIADNITIVSEYYSGTMKGKELEIEVDALKDCQIRNITVDYYKENAFLNNYEILNNIKGKKLKAGVNKFKILLFEDENFKADAIAIHLETEGNLDFTSRRLPIKIDISPKKTIPSSSSSSSGSSNSSSSSANSITFSSGSYAYRNYGGLYYFASADLSKFAYMSKSKFESYLSKMRKLPELNDGLATPVYYTLESSITVSVTKRSYQPINGITAYDVN